MLIYGGRHGITSGLQIIFPCDCEHSPENNGKRDNDATFKEARDERADPHPLLHAEDGHDDRRATGDHRDRVQFIAVVVDRRDVRLALFQVREADTDFRLRRLHSESRRLLGPPEPIAFPQVVDLLTRFTILEGFHVGERDRPAIAEPYARVGPPDRESRRERSPRFGRLNSVWVQKCAKPF